METTPHGHPYLACTACGRVHFGVTAAQARDDGYEPPAACSCGKAEFRRAKDSDCPAGATVGPVLLQEAPESPWPTFTGPGGVNPWHLDALAMVKLIADNPGFWTSDFRLKYISLRIDTRNGRFVLYDADGARIAPEDVTAAIKRWNGD